MARRMMARCSPARMSSRLSPEGEALAQLGAREHGAGRVDAHGALRAAGQRPQLVQARGSSRRRCSRGSGRSRRRSGRSSGRRSPLPPRPPGWPSCPGRRCRARCACPGTWRGRRGRGRGSRSGSAPSGRGGAAARSPCPTLSTCWRSRATTPRTARSRAGGAPVQRGHRPERVILEAARRLRRVLDLEDRLVEEADETVEADAALPGLRLGEAHVALAREVAEEVALAARPRREEPAASSSIVPRIGIRGLVLGRGAGARHEQALDLTPQDPELRPVLLQPEQPLQLGQEPGLLGRAEPRPRSSAETRREPGVDEGLRERDLAGHVVVAAAVGDAAAEDALVLAEHHRLRGGGAEVDADGVLHAAPPAAASPRFCSIIWK